MEDNKMSLVLSLLDGLKPNEIVLNFPAKGACERLRAAIELRERLLQEQKVKIGQGGRKVYKAGLEVYNESADQDGYLDAIR